MAAARYDAEAGTYDDEVSAGGTYADELRETHHRG